MPREYTFNERGIPTLAKRWDGTVPQFREFPELESGRRSRGQLEDMVDVLCKRWLVGGSSQDEHHRCTAEALAAASMAHDGRPTSTGAVSAILRKWAELGYAEVEEKPMRFVGLTARGMELGLEELYRLERRRRTGRTHYQWPEK